MFKEDDTFLRMVNIGSSWNPNWSGVEIIHMPTRIIAESLDEKTPHANKAVAMQRLKDAVNKYFVDQGSTHTYHVANERARIGSGVLGVMKANVDECVRGGLYDPSIVVLDEVFQYLVSRSKNVADTIYEAIDGDEDIGRVLLRFNQQGRLIDAKELLDRMNVITREYAKSFMAEWEVEILQWKMGMKPDEEAD